MEVNNREWAILIWMAVMATVIIVIPSARRACGPPLRAFRTRQILVPLALMVLYTAGAITLAWSLHLWDLKLLTPTIVWFVTVGLVLFFRLGKAMKEKHYFRKVALEAVSLPPIIQFVLDLYPFSLATEIGVQGALLVLGALVGLVQAKPDHYARQFLAFLLYGIIVVIAVQSITQIVDNWARIDFAGEGKKFLLPIVITAVFLPFLYVFTLFAAYQSAIAHMRATVPAGTAVTKPAIALVLKTGLSVRRVAEVTPKARMFMAETTTVREASIAFDEGRAAHAAREHEAAEKQQRLIDNAGLQGVDQGGKRLDQLEFEETKAALSYLHLCLAGHYRNSGRYRHDMLDILGAETFVKKGLPVNALITMHVTEDGQQWWAWRRTSSGWVFAIGAKEALNDRWEYDGHEVPSGGPGHYPAWRHFMVPSEPHHHW